MSDIQPALTQSEVLEEEYLELRGSLPEGYVQQRDLILREFGNDRHKCDERILLAFRNALNDESKQPPLTAVALSGGGIRSATFALGVLQALAKRTPVLRQLDYLSTVSGGGYLGSWLTAWIHRNQNGRDGVMDQLSGDAGIENIPLNPRRGPSEPTNEPEPVSHLREYSNYLTPRLGLLRPDSATLFATYLRNLMLNWLILGPLIVSMLLLPRLYVAGLLLNPWNKNVHIQTASTQAIVRMNPNLVGSTPWWMQTLAQALVLVTIVVPMLSLPSHRRKSSKQIGEPNIQKELEHHRPGMPTWKVVVFVVVPLVVSGILLSLAYAWSDFRSMPQQPQGSSWSPTRISWMAVFTIAPLIGTILERIKYGRTGFNIRRLLSLIGCGLVIGYFSHQLMAWPILGDFASHPRGYATLRVPAACLIYLLLVTLHVGFMSGCPGGDDDREWWARLMGWSSLAAVHWIIAIGISVWGPWLLRRWNLHAAEVVSPSILVALIATFAGHTRSTSTRESDQPGWRSKILASIPTVLSLIALPLFVLCASVGVNALMRHFRWDCLDFANDQLLRGDGAVSAGMSCLYILLTLVGVVTALLIAGLLMNFNRFSLHAMYRDRLVRAYLGASNLRRSEDAFTGFDADDNLPLHHLRRGRRFTSHDLGEPGNVIRLAAYLTNNQPKSFVGFISLLNDTQQANQNREKWDVAAKYDALRDAFQADPQVILADNDKLDQLQRAILNLLNTLVIHPGLSAYTSTRTPGGNPDEEPQEIQEARRALGADERPTLLNRLIIENNCVVMDDKTPRYLLRTGDAGRCPKPLHLVNMALNLVDTNVLALQSRKAVSFTASPLHCGFYKGYRRSVVYGGPISLGTAMTISGAAASPNMGDHSSPALTFLMTLFNARLGWWLGNPASPAKNKRQESLELTDPRRPVYSRADPRHSVLPLINEALGLTSDRYKYVYLSDGGHFENLGLYELVARRCRFIIVSDATRDTAYNMSDLANAVRRIKEDMGIGINFSPNRYSQTRLDENRRCSVAEICYEDLHHKSNKSGCRDGILIYLKPCPHNDQAIDVYSHSSMEPQFPHEPTSNQWFGEAQFESYRKLGFETVEHIAARMGTQPLTAQENSLQDRLYHIAERLVPEEFRAFAIAAINEAFGGAKPALPPVPPTAGEIGGVFRDIQAKEPQPQPARLGDGQASKAERKPRGRVSKQ